LEEREITFIMLNNDEVVADCNPFDSGNRLILAPDFLTGAPPVNTGRLSLGAKNPLT
jgi:aldehyde:ferredoxin oxidoreductase